MSELRNRLILTLLEQDIFPRLTERRQRLQISQRSLIHVIL